MRTHCANPKCREELKPWKERTSGTYGTGWERQPRTGRWLCPSCRYMGKWAFTIGAGLVGLAWGIIKLWL